MKKFSSRLSILADALGTSAEMSRITGIPQPTLYRWGQGLSGPNPDQVLDIATKCNVSIMWLISGEGEMFLQDGAMTFPKNTVLVPLMDFGAGAGGEQVGHDDSPKALLEVDADWLAREVRARPKDLVMMLVEGDSMEPTLHSGMLLMVDTAHTTPKREGVYVLRVGEGVLVKRIELTLDGGVLIKSDNSKYRTHEIAPDSQESLTALGRVVWGGKPM